jgi:hypothetical protein
MLIMSAVGAFIAAFMVPNRANIMGGTIAFYLTASAWITVWRKPGQTGRLEIGTTLLAFAAAGAGLIFAIQASNSPKGLLDGSGAVFYAVFGSAALLGALLDVRMIVRGGFTGAARTTRHLCRMCIAMFIATGSLFLGQARLFPPEIRQSGVLKIPVFLVLGAFVYFLIRVRVVPMIRRRARVVRAGAIAT